MTDENTFSRLVAELSLEERQGLLRKLQENSKISLELLYVEDNKLVPFIDSELEFKWLPLYLRIWYFIKSIFKSKSPHKLFEERGLTMLGKKIDKKFPKLYNHRTGMLLPAFFKHIINLKEAAGFFYAALDASVNRNRNAFFAFMGSLEMPFIHKQLQEETDPAVIVENNPDVSERELRQLALKAMEDSLSQISEDQKGIMYLDARSLFCLKGLSTFSFDRLLTSFTYNREERGETCYAVSIREFLVSLNDILFSLKTVPHMTLLQSLFVFMLRRRVNEKFFDFDSEISSLLTQAAESLDVIREFNKQVPLNLIIRCFSRDLSIVPNEISGGEDWYILYRDYWKKTVESLCNEYSRKNQHRKLFISFNDFFKGQDLEVIKYIHSDSNPEGIPLRGSWALSFLRSFSSIIFMPDISRILLPIYNDGEFKEEDTHVEFSWSYGYLLRLEEEIDKFEEGISPVGLHGERYSQAYKENSAPDVKKRRLKLIVDKVQREANEIIEQSRKACQSMTDILSGIHGENPAENRVYLTNYFRISGTDERFLPKIGEAVLKLKTALKLLSETDGM